MKPTPDSTSSKTTKFPNRLILVGIVLLISLVSAAVYMGLRSSGSGDSSGKAATPLSQPVSADKDKTSDGPCPAPLYWQTDARQMYDYDMETDILLDPSVLTGNSGQKTKVRVSVKGILNFRIFDDPVKSSDSSEKIQGAEKSVYAGFQFSPAEVKLYGESETEGRRMTELESLYETFFVTAFSTEGMPSLFYFPAPLDEKDKNSVSELIKIAQLSISTEESSQERDDKGTVRWYKDEIRSTGAFKAEYAVHQAACNEIIKKNISCLAVRATDILNNAAKDIKLTGHIVDSEFRGTTAPNVSWLKTFSGSETFEIRVGNDVWSESKGTIRLSLRAYEPNPELAIWKENRPIKDILLSFADPEKKSKAPGAWEQERVKGLSEQFKDVSASQLMQKLKDAVSAGANQSDLAVLTHTLKDFFEIYPEKALSVPGLLKDMNLSDQAAGSVLLALQLAGHSQAQTALKAVFEDEGQTADNRLRAIVASGGIQKPEKELIGSLFGMAETREGKTDDGLERSDTAFLALGILSDTLSKSEKPSDSQAVNERIINYLQNSQDEREHIICLKALDNTANPEVISVVEPYLLSDSVMERSAAVSALRNFSDAHSLELLSDALENDPEDVVRGSAVDALAERGGIDAVEQIRTRLPNEPEENLRRNMIRFLGKNKTPAVVETLKKQLEAETSRDIAKDIFRALYEKKTEGQ